MMVTNTFFIPTAATQGVSANIKAVLKLLRTTVTATKASPIIYNVSGSV